MREACHKQKGNRIIQVNHRVVLKEQAHQRLKTDKGIYYRKKRPADVEPVFGNIKHNKNFKRFLLKGIDKTEIEWGLLCIAHNQQYVVYEGVSGTRTWPQPPPNRGSIQLAQRTHRLRELAQILLRNGAGLRYPGLLSGGSRYERCALVDGGFGCIYRVDAMGTPSAWSINLNVTFLRCRVSAS